MYPVCQVTGHVVHRGVVEERQEGDLLAIDQGDPEAVDDKAVAEATGDHHRDAARNGRFLGPFTDFALQVLGAQEGSRRGLILRQPPTQLRVGRVREVLVEAREALPDDFWHVAQRHAGEGDVALSLIHISEPTRH